MLRLLLSLLLLAGVFGDGVKRSYKFQKSVNQLHITAEYSDEVSDDKSKGSGGGASKSSSRNTGAPPLGPSKDRLDIQIETGSGLKFHLKYFEKTADSSAKYQFHQYIKDIMEYTCRPTCGTGTDCCPYDPALDMPLGANTTYALTSWNDVTYGGCADDGACTADFETTDGNFKATFRINTAGLTAGSVSLDQSDIKFDITEVYPLRGTAGQTALTIRATVESMSKTSQTAGSGGDNDQVSDDPDAGLNSNLIWTNTIQCGNNQRGVKTNGLGTGVAENGGTAKSVNWSILKLKSDTNCVWDPAVQFVDTRFCAACWAVWFLVGSVVLCLCCCCVGGFCYYRRKQGGGGGSKSIATMTEME